MDNQEIALRCERARNISKYRPQLEDAEKRIEHGLYQMATALKDIEKGELWRYAEAKYESMDDYTMKKYGFGLRRRQQLAHAEEVRLALADMVTTDEARTFVQDMREGHVRTIETIPVEARVEVVEAVAALPGKKTSTDIIEIAESKGVPLRKPAKLKPAKAKTISKCPHCGEEL